MNAKNINLLKSHLMKIALQPDYPTRFDMESYAYAVPGTRIKVGEKKFFDKSVRLEHEIPDYVCKTAACLAGHAIIVSGQVAKIKTQLQISWYAASWLGFTVEDSAKLFYTEYWEEDNFDRYECGNETDRIIAALDQLDHVCKIADPGNMWKIHDHDAIRELKRI